MSKVLDSAVLALLVASVCLNVVMIRREYTRNRPAPLHPSVGDVLPSLSLATVQGQRRVVGFGGVGARPKLVYAFSPECAWCERNLQGINQLADGLRSHYDVIAVAVRAKDIRKYAERKQLRMDIYHQPADETVRAYGFGTTPQTLIVDSAGRIVSHWRGAFGRGAASEIRRRYGINVEPVPDLP